MDKLIQTQPLKDTPETKPAIETEIKPMDIPEAPITPATKPSRSKNIDDKMSSAGTVVYR